MARCPRCETEVVDPTKDYWKYGVFKVKMYECPCGNQFREYFIFGSVTIEFVWCLLVSFLLIVGSLWFVADQAHRTVTLEEARQVQIALKARMSERTASSIFVNNLAASWFLVAPYVGLILFGVTLCNTAWHIGVLAVAQQTAPQTLVAKALVFGFAETLAYTVMLAENLYLSWIIVKKPREDATARLTSHSWKSFLLYLVLLFLGAVLEERAL